MMGEPPALNPKISAPFAVNNWIREYAIVRVAVTITLMLMRLPWMLTSGFNHGWNDSPRRLASLVF